MGKTAVFVIKGNGFEGMEGETAYRVIRRLVCEADDNTLDYFEVEKNGSLKTGDLLRYKDYDVFIFVYGILFIIGESIGILSEIVKNRGEFSVIVPVSNESRASHQSGVPPFFYQTTTALKWAVREMYKKFNDEVSEAHEIDDFCLALGKDALNDLPEDCNLNDLPQIVKKSGLRLGIAKGVYVHRYGNCYESGRTDLMAHVPLEAKDILDIGSAGGGLGGLLKKRQSCVVTGVDIDKELIKIARDKLDDVMHGDIEDLVDKGVLGIYDCIICGDVLEHLNNPWKVVKGLKSHLRKGGLFIASSPNIANWAIIQEMLQGEWSYVPFSILSGTHIRFFTRKTFLELFEDSGYTIREVLLQSFDIPPGGVDFLERLGRLMVGTKMDELKAHEIVVVAGS